MFRLCTFPPPAPLVPSILLAQGALGHELRFAQALDAGALVFSEQPLVEDAVAELLALGPAGERLHQARHNARWAWSIVEQMLATLDTNAIEELLAAGYATGLGAARWESPGDDDALAYVTTEQWWDVSVVRALYDMVATNNIITRTRLVNAAPGVTLEVAARHGFYLALSRANHACEPTATLQIPPEAGGVTHVVTTRAVAAGEPLTIDYVLRTPLGEKRAAVLDLYGFCCQCPRCAPLCSYVGCAARATRRCPCGRAHYCANAEHQRLDWPRHKREAHQ
jgi:hypothetical protein